MTALVTSAAAALPTCGPQPDAVEACLGGVARAADLLFVASIRLYVMRMDGDVAALLGRPAASLYRKAVVKVGFSNDLDRRRRELNAGLPPAGKVEWKLHLSHGLPSGTDAKATEDRLNEVLTKHGESLGGEFFLVAEAEVISTFASVLPARR